MIFLAHVNDRTIAEISTTALLCVGIVADALVIVAIDMAKVDDADYSDANFQPLLCDCYDSSGGWIIAVQVIYIVTAIGLFSGILTGLDKGFLDLPLMAGVVIGGAYCWRNFENLKKASWRLHPTRGEQA